MNSTAKPIRIYVPVEVYFDSNGNMKPRVIIWEDGQKYEIDQIIRAQSGPSRKGGRIEDRYTVWIHGQQRYLFFERGDMVVGCRLGRWFVETKTA